MLKVIRASSLAVTMLTGWALCSVLAIGAGTADSDRVSRLLSDAKTQSFQLKEDADELEGFSRSGASWESHLEAINHIKDDVNRLGRLLTDLDNNRGQAAPWQQLAIDRIIPVAKELAANTNGAIQHLDKRPSGLNTTAFQEYLEAIADYSTNLAATISDFADYGKTKERLERLAAKLEIPAGK
jgi:hypothetical protein